MTLLTDKMDRYRKMQMDCTAGKTETELETESDNLLIKAGALRMETGVKANGNSGMYGEGQLERHHRNEIQCREHIDYYAIAETDLSYMERPEMIRLCKLAKFTPDQLELWELHLDGFSASDIAEAFKVTQPAISQRIRRLKERLKEALKSDPYQGWMEVYEQETRRK